MIKYLTTHCDDDDVNVFEFESFVIDLDSDIARDVYFVKTGSKKRYLMCNENDIAIYIYDNDNEYFFDTLEHVKQFFDKYIRERSIETIVKYCESVNFIHKYSNVYINDNDDETQFELIHNTMRVEDSCGIEYYNMNNPDDCVKLDEIYHYTFVDYEI